jgi:hypothetical protein
MWLLGFARGMKEDTPCLREIVLRECYKCGKYPDDSMSTFPTLKLPDAIREPLEAAGIKITLYSR